MISWRSGGWGWAIAFVWRDIEQLANAAIEIDAQPGQGRGVVKGDITLGITRQCRGGDAGLFGDFRVGYVSISPRLQRLVKFSEIVFGS